MLHLSSWDEYNIAIGCCGFVVLLLCLECLELFCLCCKRCVLHALLSIRMVICDCWRSLLGVCACCEHVCVLAVCGSGPGNDQ